MFPWWLAAALARDTIAVDPAPQAGEPAIVAVTDDLGRPRSGLAVVADLRPGLGQSQELALGVTDGLGRVRWTPTHGGVVDLRAGDATLRTTVAWPAPPVDTAVLLGLIGAFAVAAIAWGASSPRSSATASAPARDARGAS